MPSILSGMRSFAVLRNRPNWRSSPPPPTTSAHSSTVRSRSHFRAAKGRRNQRQNPLPRSAPSSSSSFHRERDHEHDEPPTHVHLRAASPEGRGAREEERASTEDRRQLVGGRHSARRERPRTADRPRGTPVGGPAAP